MGRGLFFETFMMSKSTFINLLFIIFVGGGIYAYIVGSTKKEIEPQNVRVVDTEVIEQILSEKVTTQPAVVYTDSGFSSNSLSIKRGEAVIFENKSSRNMWVASAMHPSHRAYPDTDIQKCGVEEAKNMFDACKGFAPGTSWSFTFNEVGTWRYHNHLDARDFGNITVE